MKLVRVAIFLTGISGLAMGGIMTLSSFRANQEDALIRINETLKAQATQFVDQFFSVVEATKILSSSSANVPSYITHRGVAKLNQGVLSELESFTNMEAQNQPDAQPDFGLQERVTAAVKANLSAADFQISRILIGTYPLTDTGSHEGIFIATPIYKATGATTDVNSIEKINISLIDPAKAFGGLQKLHNGEDARAFLISKKGKVLAHSLSAYTGTDLKQVGKLKETIDHLFLGAQTGEVAKYKNMDGVEQEIAFVRAGTSPFAFGVEQKAPPSVLSGAWFSDQAASGAARKNFGILFIIIALALAGFAGASILTSRLVRHQIQASAHARVNSSQGNDPVPVLDKVFASKIAPSILQAERLARKPAPSARANDKVETPLPQALIQTADSFVQVRDQKALEKEQLSEAAQGLSAPKDFVRDFLSKIEKAYTIEAVEKELVAVTSEIAESPILYFRYHRRNQNLTLSSVAGDVRIPNYSHMQAYVRKDIELQVEHMADDGKVASISNYGPMNKLINMHLNVAHFEAWGVTSEPSVSGQSRLVGVLVVLHAGMRSAQARPMLAKLLKGAGNYLYAQSNKIRPRSSQYQNELNPVSALDDSNFS